MGKPRSINWTWDSNTSDIRRGYMALDGRMSVTELIAYMREVAPGVPLNDIEVNWSTVVWTRAATSTELAERGVANERRQERHEEWERKTLAKLTEKYGAPKQCGSRGWSIGRGCVLPKGHDGPHGYSDGSGGTTGTTSLGGDV